MRRICLISPGHLATNPRLVKEADALSQAGCEVVVLSARFLAWAADEDRRISMATWSWLSPLPFGPSAPLQTRLRHFIVQRLAKLLYRIRFRPQWLSEAAWHPLTPDLVLRARSIKADLYIAHYPAALPAAARAAKKYNAKYAYDAEDYHLGDPPDTVEFEEQRSLLRQIEARYLPGCAYVSAASPGIAHAYAQSYNVRRPSVIRNVFPLAHAPKNPSSFGTANPGPSLYWFSQTIGPDRGVECAVRAIARAKSRPHIYLRGSISSSFRARLHSIANEAGVMDRIHLLELASPCDMEMLASTYDLGLVGETGYTPNHKIALANKLFSYLLAGIPAVISDIPAHLDYASEVGNAVRVYRVEDPESLATAIDYYLASGSDFLESARMHAYSLGQERFNWEAESSVLLELVSSVFYD